jgi:hypothetical protein
MSWKARFALGMDDNWRHLTSQYEVIDIARLKRDIRHASGDETTQTRNFHVGIMQRNKRVGVETVVKS